MQLGNADTPSNKLPEAFMRCTSSSERARLRFTVKGNAILTGGAGDLALESARALLEHGLSGLALLDLPAAFEKADVSEARVVGEIRSQLGRLNILCYFAGIVCPVFAEDMSADQWKKVLDVNTTGTWLVTQAVG
ncbi:hypothetical protein ACJ72_07476, partial [Emergomyces africanus]